MASSPKEHYTKLGGRILKLTNPDKILFPAAGFAKRDLIRYYQRVAETALPHLRNRPFTLHRFPSGVEGESFYEKECPPHRPKWMATGHFGGVNYCLINDLPSLIWVANLAAIELHPTLARIENMQRPTQLIFDLDPGEGMGLAECASIALLLRRFLTSLRLDAYPKTSGKKGLHLLVPLNSTESYREATEFSRLAAEFLERKYPDQIVSKMAKKLRAGKIFIDWSQNVDFKSTVGVYSLRANRCPGVSTPLQWSEVAEIEKSASAARRVAELSPDAVIARIRKFGDLAKPALTQSQKLPPESVLALPMPRLRFKAA